jgi:hypothetical protein
MANSQNMKVLKYICGMRRKVVFLFVCFAYSLSSYSQEENKPLSLTYRSTMIGIGETHVYDTLLSPLEYKGTNVGLIYEEMRRMTSWNENIFSQHLFTLEIAETKSPTKAAIDYAGNLEYGYGLYYRLETLSKIQFFTGMQADGLIGFIYNSRNGNNPVTAKSALNLNLSGIATYNFQIKKQPFFLRYQLNIPFVGLTFSPEYGQSYYEISLDKNATVVYPASFHNQLAMRNLFSVELPFHFCTLHLAYMNWIYETKVNSLDTRMVSNSMYIGVSRNFFSVPGRKINKNKYSSVFE